MGFYDNYSNRSLSGYREELQKKMYKKLFRKYIGNCFEGKKFLEIGPGTGLIAEIVTQLGGKYTAVEGNEVLSKKLIDKDFDVVNQTVPPIPFSDNSFDYVFHSHLIEHMPSYTDAFKLTEECFRVIKPGGRLVFIAPDYMRLGKYYWDCDYTHSFVVTERRIGQLLQDSGAKDEFILRYTEPFSGRFGRYVGVFMQLFPYTFLIDISPVRFLKLFFYKIRATFIQCLLVVVVKK